MRRLLRSAAVAAAMLLGLSACTAPAQEGPTPASTPRVSAPAPATPAPTPTGPASTVAVVGDSLSRGFNACAHYGDCPSVSWAGGTRASTASRPGSAPCSTAR